jgi:hypothetical protein
MLKRINRLDRLALKLKCQDCGKRLVIAEAVCQEITGYGWLEVAAADLRLSEAMAVRTRSLADNLLCWWCAKRAVEPLPWSKLNPDQLRESTKPLRDLFGVQEEEPLSVLTERMVAWWRTYKRNPSAGLIIRRPGGQR